MHGLSVVETVDDVVTVIAPVTDGVVTVPVVVALTVGESAVVTVIAPVTDGVVTVPEVVALTVGGSAVVTVSARVAILVELTLVVGCDSVEFTTSPTNTSPEPKESSMMKTSSSVMGAVIVESSSWCISKHSDK